MADARHAPSEPTGQGVGRLYQAGERAPHAGELTEKIGTFVLQQQMGVGNGDGGDGDGGLAPEDNNAAPINVEEPSDGARGDVSAEATATCAAVVPSVAGSVGAGSVGAESVGATTTGSVGAGGSALATLMRTPMPRPSI